MVEVTFASKGDVPDLHALVRKWTCRMDAELFELDDKVFFSRHVEEEGRLLVVRGPDVRALQIIRVPGMADDNLGRDVDLGEEELMSVVHAETVAVAPPHRGGGLQRLLLEWTERWAEERGFHWLMATVHPDNGPSLRNLLRHGFTVRADKQKYGGKRRFVMAKELT